MTRLRSQRSTSAPAGNKTSEPTRASSAATNPACAGEPVRVSTSSGNARSGANEVQGMGSQAAKWIAKDALRELRVLADKD